MGQEHVYLYWHWTEILLDNRALSPIKATTNKFDPSDRHLDGLLEHNRQWAKAVKKQQPDFFEQINLKQEPKILWIGMDLSLHVSSINNLFTLVT